MIIVKKERDDMLTSKANKILVDEIFPLVTKAFSSMTSELMSQPQYWKDDSRAVKKIFEDKGEMFISAFKNYVKGTISLQYDILTAPPIKKDY